MCGHYGLLSQRNFPIYEEHRQARPSENQDMPDLKSEEGNDSVSRASKQTRNVKFKSKTINRTLKK